MQSDEEITLERQLEANVHCKPFVKTSKALV